LPLSEKQLKTLADVCDSLVPSVAPSVEPFDALTATSIGVDKALADIIDAKLEPSLRAQFYRLLDIFDSRAYNLLLTGKPSRFSQLSREGREAYLKAWRDSRLGTKRTAFQAR
jgi:hypothetical protein